MGNEHERMKQSLQERYVDAYEDAYEDESPSFDNRSSDLGTVEDYLKGDNEFSESKVLSDEPSTTTDHSGSGISNSHVSYAGSTDGNTLFFAVLVILMWIGAIGTFIYIGISSELGDTQSKFDRVGESFVIDIESALRDYDSAGRWVYFHCHEHLHTQDSFHDMYDYIRQGLGEISSIGWLQNVSHDSRSTLEDESRTFLNTLYPNSSYPYIGIGQFDPNPNYNASDAESPEFIKTPVDERPWYVVLHHVAPTAAQDLVFLDVNVYNSQWSADIDKAIDTFQPVITEPTERLFSDIEGRDFFATLLHPGVDHEIPDQRRNGLSWISVSFASILSAVSERHVTNEHSLAFYIFDSTHQNEGVEPTYLGGSLIRRGSFYLLKAIENYDELETRNRIRYETEIDYATRQFTVLVLPLSDFYDPDLSFILFGGFMTFSGSFFLVMWLYHNFRRGQKVQDLLARAKAENAIVASLFPSAVHSRLIRETTEQQQQEREEKKASFHKSKRDDFETSNTTLFSVREKILAGGDASLNIFGSKPIADLFPDATIMFGDLVGFTAWSSVREPAQVFTLLETIYHAFDTIAKKRRIFKVETVGDCYVAVAGLPQPRKDHAVAMARFATDCRNEMQDLVKSLETVLGPDTGELNLRVGLHSGEVTAGVLRGDKGRFQLFGDTMNTASRMESTGRPGEIQVSESTAEILKSFKKGRWLKPREDKIVAKGKGELNTFWLDLSIDMRNSSTSHLSSELSISSKTSSAGEEKKDERDPGLHISEPSARSTAVEDEKIKRLIKWNVEVLAVPLKKIVARRQAVGKLHRTVTPKKAGWSLQTGKMPLDEVEEIIVLPEFNDKIQMNQTDGKSVELGHEVMSQLHDYVSVVASLYHHNPFHNFEHASHVIMSVTKLLSRIIEPTEMVRKEENQGDVDHDLHDYTFGITSDPLTQFACALSALIHDVDHPGVPNATLVKEQSFMARAFKNKSVAEQNSVEIGWQLLMGKEYQALQECIYCDQEEFDRFRQLVVNVVMATDVMDKDLGAQRKARWEKAFSDACTLEASSPQEDKNRKATIVIEHIIQASDIAHTMQHWHIYAKWNERLFGEMYRAYEAGRLATNPVTAWYEGEKGFFDFYVIPLAKKLDTCGVFGASSHEYHNYAVRNREEWNSKGQAMVAHYLEKYRGAGQLDASKGREYGSIRGRQNVERYLSKLSIDDKDILSEMSQTSSASSAKESATSDESWL